MTDPNQVITPPLSKVQVFSSLIKNFSRTQYVIIIFIIITVIILISVIDQWSVSPAQQN